MIDTLKHIVSLKDCTFACCSDFKRDQLKLWKIAKLELIYKRIRSRLQIEFEPIVHNILYVAFWDRSW